MGPRHLKLISIFSYDSREDREEEDLRKCRAVPFMNVRERGNLTVIAVHHLN